MRLFLVAGEKVRSKVLTGVWTLTVYSAQIEISLPFFCT